MRLEEKFPVCIRCRWGLWRGNQDALAECLQQIWHRGCNIKGRIAIERTGTLIPPYVESNSVRQVTVPIVSLDFLRYLCKFLGGNGGS